MKRKFFVAIQIILLGVSSFLWFFLSQAAYEVITKPELRNEIPFVPGILGTYLFGLIVLILTLLIPYLIYILFKK